jgi:tRNA nucleotidyltransferase/poly(A) polymerase
MKNLEIINNLESIKALTNLGAEIYLVGGCVRDHYLGKESKDIDIIVSLIDDKTIITCLEKFGKVDKVGESFGVIKFMPFGWIGEPIDVAQPRIDILEDKSLGHHGIKARFDPFIPIDEEIGRRDFTINSIAVKLDGTIIDPFNGLQDIENKIIRATSNQSFTEDPLRMLRAIQFSSRFGFDIETNTWEMILQNCSDIKTISGERIIEELNKIFYKGDINKGIKLFIDSGLHKQLFPNVRYVTPIDDNIYTIEDFYFTICGSCENFKNVLKGDNSIFNGIKAISYMLELSHYSTPVERMNFFDCYKISNSLINSKIIEFHFGEVQKEFRDGKLPKKITELAINGEDLMGQGFKGKEIGDRQKFLLMEIFEDNRKNTIEDLSDLAQEVENDINITEKNSDYEIILGNFFVFDYKNSKFQQISVDFQTIDDANSFIETMKLSFRYKDSILVAMEVKNIKN